MPQKNLNTPQTAKASEPAPAKARFLAVADAIKALGLSGGKTAKVGGRVNPELLRLAKSRTGVESDSAVLELALGNLVIEDGFPETFQKVRGTVASDIDLGI